jgi:uncharacterized protein (DUF3820 family)
MKNHSTDTFTFGKYKGEHFEDVDDNQYLEWCLETLDDRDEITLEFMNNINNKLMMEET